MNEKMKVGVIMGGVSSELEISMMTGKEMLTHLNVQHYDIRPIVITNRQELIQKVRGINFALLALHGEFGEDGTIQGTLEEVAELPDKLHDLVRSMELTCYKTLACEVYTRVDMIVHDGIPYVLEVNTLPGMTTNSLLPKSAQAAGISFSQLLDKVIMYSLEARKRQKGGAVYGY